MTGETVHATCVAIGGAGVLIVGPPGSGKSDLALRLIDADGRGTGAKAMRAVLVSDDRTALAREPDGTLAASAPETIAGRLEVRGLGIVECPYTERAPVRLAVRLSDAQTIDRMPELAKSRFEALGVSVPLVLVDARSPSAPARVRAALRLLGA